MVTYPSVMAYYRRYRTVILILSLVKPSAEISGVVEFLRILPRDQVF